MKKLLLTLLLLIAFPVMASHIVGGEFELIHLTGNTYRLNLIIYFDVLNGNPGAQDPFVDVRIFRKRDNFIMANQIRLTFNREERVSYTQPACSKGEIVTKKLYYTTTITLAPEQYNDPQGYYVAWERCCRNYSITNIFSNAPPSSQFAGQTFYLEFPPVIKDGKEFINNSPRLFPPLNDYGCINKPYYVDFAGTDDDKDSLVYSLVAPLNTFSGDALPPGNLPRPGPYNPIQWRPDFGINRILRGAPDLKVSTEGFLTVTPTLEGLFVFAVKCEEFRKGVKIGEVRRDFQMLVIDCPKADPPVIVGKKSTDVTFPMPNTNSLSVSFANTTTDADRYIDVKISDRDVFKGTTPDFFSEKIKLKVVPINFKRKAGDTWFPESSATLTNGADSIKTFKVFFPQCPYLNGPYQVGIVAYDDACSLPLTDTLRVTVNTQPPPNTRAYFTTQKTTIVQITEGDPLLSLPFQAKDNELDDLVVSVVTDGFSLGSYGMAVTFTQQKGLVNGQLTWDPRCNVFDFTKRTAFTVRILVDDKDLCNFGDPDTVTYKLNIKLPGNADPNIDTDLTTATNERKVSIQKKVLESVSFNVIGKDVIDNDLLVLSAKGIGFNISDLSAGFQQVTGRSTVSSLFSWNLKCDKIDLKKKDLYTFQFIVVDNANKCRFYKADTVDVDIKLLPPDNAKPKLVAFSPSLASITNSNLEYRLGQPIEFSLVGTDADLLPSKDNLTLTLVSASGDVEPSGYTFEKATGQSPVQSAFSWSPDCSIFKNQVFENNYSFRFRLADDRCITAKADTIRINIKIKDVDGSDKDFYLPNVFTPNGDKHNDFFALEGFEWDESGVDFNEKVSLPKDNCVNTFESVKIFNRWGDLVFESTDRKFRWYADNESAGVYYYRVKYSNKEYKSPLSLRN